MRLPRDQKTFDLRIFEVKKNFTGSNYEEVARRVGLNRTTIYNAISRFNLRAKNEPDFLQRYNHYLSSGIYTEKITSPKPKGLKRPSGSIYKHYSFIDGLILYKGTGTKIVYQKPFAGEIVQLWEEFKNAKYTEEAVEKQRRLNQYFMNIERL